MRSVALIPEATLVGLEEVARCLAALQVQVSRDFAATWGSDARLRTTNEPDEEEEILYLLDDAAQADALGHARHLTGERPCGFVLLRPYLEAGAAWQAAVSHELLEMLADPLLYLAVQGPSPQTRPLQGEAKERVAAPLYSRERGGGEGALALFALEVCDPVQGDDYAIADVPVANFVLPTWFLPEPLADATLVDFLGRLADPFTLAPGGQASYCTELGRWQTWFAKRCPPHRRQPSAYSRRRRRMQRGINVRG
jgi:hypothetical protein